MQEQTHEGAKSTLVILPPFPFIFGTRSIDRDQLLATIETTNFSSPPPSFFNHSIPTALRSFDDEFTLHDATSIAHPDHLLLEQCVVEVLDNEEVWVDLIGTVKEDMVPNAFPSSSIGEIPLLK
ncbi:hypothetical protein SEVIR_3G152650v4 [Setaria viridis]